MVRRKWTRLCDLRVLSVEAKDARSRERFLALDLSKRVPVHNRTHQGDSGYMPTIGWGRTVFYRHTGGRRPFLAGSLGTLSARQNL